VSNTLNKLVPTAQGKLDTTRGIRTFDYFRRSYAKFRKWAMFSGLPLYRKPCYTGSQSYGHTRLPFETFCGILTSNNAVDSSVRSREEGDARASNTAQPYLQIELHWLQLLQ
jgi:hypothetical protein